MGGLASRRTFPLARAVRMVTAVRACGEEVLSSLPAVLLRGALVSHPESRLQWHDTTGADLGDRTLRRFVYTDVKL